jgi:uncharacterized lipoprotein YbaY
VQWKDRKAPQKKKPKGPVKVDSALEFDPRRVKAGHRLRVSGRK